jgi:hypothetical protein
MPKTQSIVFPYSIKLREEGLVEIFPAARVTFITKPNKHFLLVLLIDSGAAISALPKSDAEELGADLRRGTPIPISGISGTITRGIKYELDAQIGNEKSRSP